MTSLQNTCLEIPARKFYNMPARKRKTASKKPNGKTGNNPRTLSGSRNNVEAPAIKEQWHSDNVRTSRSPKRRTSTSPRRESPQCKSAKRFQTPRQVSPLLSCSRAVSPQRTIYTKKAMACVKKTTRQRSRSESSVESLLFSDLENEDLDDPDYDWDLARERGKERSESPNSERSIAGNLGLLRRKSVSPDVTAQSKSKQFDTDYSTVNKWTPKKESLLCTLWEEEEHLYNTKHPNYRNPILRNKTIERFAAALNMHADSVEKRIKSIWTVYRKLCFPPSGSAAPRYTIKQKKIMDMCSFLRTHLQNREPSSNLPKKSTDAANAPECSDKDISDDEVQQTQPTQVPVKPKGKRSRSKDTSKDHDVMIGISNAVSSVTDLMKSKDEASDNDNVIWARFLARKLNRLDENEADDFKLKVDSMILEVIQSTK